MAISKQKRDEIVAQALNEIIFARNYKQGKVARWKMIEDAYYGKKTSTTESRANVDLGKMQSFVHTLLSKIDNPLSFKFSKKKAAQLKRVNRLNALKQIDSENDFWDLKDLAGKKQAIMYGRAIYSYYADSVNGYAPHLENVDVYDFLIDPACGGLDIENAMYMGRYGVVKTRSQLKDGVKSKMYLKEEVKTLLDGAGTATESSQEQTNKQTRTADTNVYKTQKEIENADKFKFWEWYTTYEGVRYYLLLSPKGATAIRVEELTDLFPKTKETPLGAFPFWTYAPFPDLTEFWSVSYCDYVLELFYAQAVSINQMLDNAEQINRPQRVIDVTAIENLAELKYRKDGYIRSKTDATKAVHLLQVPSINTPIEVFNILESVAQSASGVTANELGIAEPDGKATIYEGNSANAADRFGLFNKSYSFGYRRFAMLYQQGVRSHLIKKVAIDILGPDGVEIEEVSKKDIFWKDDSFGVLVEASNAELALSAEDKKTKLTFLGANSQNPIQNPKKAYETEAAIVGFSEEEIRQLMDSTEFGDAGLMSEAERDIELLLDGQNIPVNQKASIAYKQRFVDYIQDNTEDINEVQFIALTNYVDQLAPVIQKNMITAITDKLMQQTIQQGALNGSPASPVPQNAGIIKPNINPNERGIQV